MLIVTIVLLIVGFIFLIKGADFFVDGASSLASIAKIPESIIGLTIVAFGTSAPELAVSATASFTGSNTIAVTNVVGSNIFNLLVVLGSCALIKSVPLAKDTIKHDFPFLIFSCLILTGFVAYGWSISRFEGAILVLIILLFVAYLVKKTRDSKKLDISEPDMTLSKSIIYIIGGLIGIVLGGDFVVDQATILAYSVGMSETLVGLTIVSIGTSLPELVTSITAIRKDIVDIAVGNVIGSNFFNILFVLGISALINPLAVNSGIIVDILIMIGVTLLCYFIGRKYKEYTFKAGVLFLIMFIIYMIFIILRN